MATPTKRPSTMTSTPDTLRDYIKKHEVEPLLVEALKSAVDADSPAVV